VAGTRRAETQALPRLRVQSFRTTPGSLTAGDIAAMFGISRQSALKEAGKLLEMNVLAPVGKGRGAHYVRK